MESFFDGVDDGNKRSRKQLKSSYKREFKKEFTLDRYGNESKGSTASELECLW
jgi:hypothetical protein